jgi:hypothetical protein
MARATLRAIAVVVGVLSVALASPVDAQVPESIIPSPTPDSTPVKKERGGELQPAAPDSLKPPLSPKRAFLTSLLLPGYAQSRLNRPTGSMLYATVEVVAIGMMLKSAQDLRIAKGSRSDSVIVGYTTNNGVAVPTYAPGRYTIDRIKARRTHYEDWIAALIFNHLISAADAYVAANLWDFNANVSVSHGRRTATISARRSF